MSPKVLNLESSGGLLLTKEQLQAVLEDMTPILLSPPDLFGPTQIMPPFKKLGVLVDFEDIEDAKSTEPKKCNKIKNNVNLKTSQSQSYSCIQCRRNLPTAHLLDLHITEQHDLYFAASVERGDKPLYVCYIEECAIKFHSPSERKNHCISVHKFPANYRFDQEKGHKNRGRKQKEAVSLMEVDADVNPVPASQDTQLPYIKGFSFGHHTQRSFNTRKERDSGKTLLDVQAMKDALDEME